MTETAGSGSSSQKHGSADPDPDPSQNVMDQEHCGDGIIYSESGPLPSVSGSSPTLKLLRPVLWIRVRIRTESTWIWLSRDLDPYWNASGSRSKEIGQHSQTNLISSLSKRLLYCSYVLRRNTYI
jgi:hypothetical protein